MLLKFIYIFLFLEVACSGLSAQNTFLKRIDIAGSSEGNALAQTKDGGYVVAGTYYDISDSQRTSLHPYILKTNSFGNILWSKQVGNTPWGLLTAITGTSDGGSIGIGSSDTGAIAKLLVIKFSSDGITEWSYKISASQSVRGYSIIQTKDGGYAIAGFSDSTFGTLIAKLNADGKAEWMTLVHRDSHFAPTNGALPSTIIQLDDGSYVVGAESSFLSTSSATMVLFKLSSDGTVLWQKITTVKRRVSEHSLVKTSDGGFALCGATDDFDPGIFELYVAKFDSSGHFLWGRGVDGFANAISHSITEGANGDLVVAGFFSLMTPIVLSPPNIVDSMLIVKFSAAGEMKDLKYFVLGKFTSVANAIIATSDSGFMLSGRIGFLPGFNHNALLLAKFDSNLSGCNFHHSLVTTFAGGKIIDSTFFQIPFTGEDTVSLGESGFINSILTDLCNFSVFSESLALTEADISLYPNPLVNENLLIIHISGNLPAGIYDLSILDLLGNTIKKEKVNLTGAKQNILFNISEFAAGVYIVELWSESELGRVHRVKFIKEN